MNEYKLTEDKMMSIPKDVIEILNRLNAVGHDAYIVGGCVRDLLYDRPPHDYDFCTSALPDEIEEVFKNEKVIETGKRYGTITVVLNGVNYEITTFRNDGSYEDGRHPKDVAFTTSLKEDLSRRDFTINAMAYNPKTGLIDPFGGQADLENEIVKCVGDPNERFEEDKLRMLRAVRFVLAYFDDESEIDSDTYLAILRNYHSINAIAVERVHDELFKIFGDYIWMTPTKYQYVSLLLDMISTVLWERNFSTFELQEITRYLLQSFNYNSPYVKFAALVYPKLYPYFDDSYLKKLRFSKEEIIHIKNVMNTGLRIYDKVINEGKSFKLEDTLTCLNKCNDIEDFKQGIMFYEVLIEKHKDDLLKNCNVITEHLKLIEKEAIPFKVSGLAINGNDLIEIGFHEGMAIGVALDRLLHLVIYGKVKNNKDDLKKEAKKLYDTEVHSMNEQ